MCRFASLCSLSSERCSARAPSPAIPAGPQSARGHSSPFLQQLTTHRVTWTSAACGCVDTHVRLPEIRACSTTGVQDIGWTLSVQTPAPQPPAWPCHFTKVVTVPGVPLHACVCWGHRDKVPQAGRLQQEVTFVPGLEAGRPRSRLWPGWFLLRPLSLVWDAGPLAVSHRVLCVCVSVASL